MKLHSVHTLLKGRSFAGTFEVGNSRYALSFAPTRAEIADSRLVLRGKLTIAGPDQTEHSREGVRATLASSQGGLGAAPANLSALRGRREQSEAARAVAVKLAATDSTGPASFTGALYFHFEPLDGKSLGVPADLERVQLNARLFATDDTARTLQGIFSALADVILAEPKDSGAASALVDELNRLLTSR